MSPKENRVATLVGVADTISDMPAAYIELHGDVPGAGRCEFSYSFSDEGVDESGKKGIASGKSVLDYTETKALRHYPDNLTPRSHEEVGEAVKQTHTRPKPQEVL